MLEAIISSKTRIKLLLKFFLNSNTSGYLRGLQQEFGESSNGIRIELNRFEKSGLLNSYHVGNKKYFKSNTNHPLYNEIHSIILKYVGFDKLIETVIENLGKLKMVYVIGDFAKGIDGKKIELIFIGDIDKAYLKKLIVKAKKLIGRKIEYRVYDDSMKMDLTSFPNEPLLLWQEDE
ncbi:MAG: ArsR family transcriptional regulator [Saprospiraceae bacterium]